MIGALFTLVIWLLVFGIVYWAIIWLVDSIPIPDPPGRFIKLAAMVLMVLMVIVLLLNLIGVSTGVNLPALNTQ